MSIEGMKFDTGKAPIARGFSRYFPRAVDAVALISQFGFDKYKEWGGWKKVPDAYNRYDDAHGRHDNALQRGETHCPESHKLHLAHRAWNAMATLELYLIEQDQKAKDQSRADAKAEDDKLALKQWRADKFSLLHSDAMARMQGKNLDGSDRRDTTVVPPVNVQIEGGPTWRTCRDCKAWSACARMGQCIGAEAEHD